MKKILMIYILLVFSIFASSNNNKIIKASKLDTFHILSSLKNDTLVFISTVENKIFKSNGRYCIFAKKNNDQFEILAEFYFEDAYDFEYIINDFDGDGMDEVIVMEMDEAYYNISLFKLVNKPGLKINKKIIKENIWISQTENMPLYKITKNKNGKIKSVNFYEGLGNGKVRRYVFKYIKKGNKFILE